jgi:hypothetical protein
MCCGRVDDVLHVGNMNKVPHCLIESVLKSLKLNVKWRIEIESGKYMVYVTFKPSDPSSGAAWWMIRHELVGLIENKKTEDIQSVM